MSEEIVELGIEFNALLQHWPDEVAHAFRLFSVETLKNKTALTQEQLEQCAASLERTFPFYKRKFEKEPENRLEFTKHFFAGACGFGDNHLTMFFKQKDNTQRIFDRDDIQILFGDDYVISFDECSREHSDSENEKTILQNAYFGDFVAAFRWLSIVFRTALAGTEDKDETRSRFHAVLLLGYLMDKENAYKLQQYIQPTLTKETSKNPELAEDFVEYYLYLHSPDDKEDDGDSGEPASLYSEVLREAEEAYRMQYQPQQCAHCRSFYFDGPFNAYDSHDTYCSPVCQKLHTHWEKQFNKKIESLANTRDRPRNFLNHACIDDLLKNFNLKLAIEKYGQLQRKSRLIDLDGYMLNLFIAIEARNDKAYLFRQLLCDFLREGLDAQGTKRSYQNMVKSIEDYYDKEDLDARKKKLSPDDEIKEIMKKQYFTIY